MNEQRIICRKPTRYHIQITIHHHTQSPQLHIQQLKGSHLNSQFLSRHEASLHVQVMQSAVTGGRESPQPVYLSSRPCRPACCRWISRKVLEAVSRTLKCVYMQPAVFLQSLFPRQPVQPHITLT